MIPATRNIIRFWARHRRGIAAIISLIAGAILGFFFLTLITANDLYDYQDSVDGVHFPEVDAIVVLGGGRGRIATAGDVWYRYWETSLRDKKQVPSLYLSGMGPQTTIPIILTLVRSGVRDVLKSDSIVLERESLNTVENATHFARVCAEQKWKRILLITSRYHMRRSKLIFEGVFWALEMPLTIETLSVYQEPFEPDEWRKNAQGIQVTLFEYWKWVFYRTFWQPEDSAHKRRPGVVPVLTQ